MSSITAYRIGSPKPGGLALMLSSLCLAAGNTLLLTVHRMAQTNAALEAYARGITNYVDVWHLAHTLLILAPALWLFGFLTLYGALVDRGERSFSLAALLALNIASLAHITSALEGGFLIPILAQDFLTAAVSSQLASGSMLDYSRLLTLTLAAFAVLLELVATGLFGASMLRARLYSHWLGWAGLIIGLLGLLGYLSGVFGPYWISSPLFLPLGAASSLWIIVLGLNVYRDPSRAG